MFCSNSDTYVYDEKEEEGVISLESGDFEFVVSENEIDIDEAGDFTKVDDKDFDIQEFIDDNTTTYMTTAATTAAATAAAETTAAYATTYSPKPFSGIFIAPVIGSCGIIIFAFLEIISTPQEVFAVTYSVSRFCHDFNI